MNHPGAPVAFISKQAHHVPLSLLGSEAVVGLEEDQEFLDPDSEPCPCPAHTSTGLSCAGVPTFAPPVCLSSDPPYLLFILVQVCPL